MSLISAALDVVKGDSKKTPEFDSSIPLEVNPVPVIYGRPGWQPVTPVIVGKYHASGAFGVTYLVSEGVQRAPDAVKISGYLDLFATKYSAGDVVANLSALAERASGDAASGYGAKICRFGLYHHGLPAGISRMADDDTRYVEFQGLAALGLVFENAARKYIGDAVPGVEVLPNGVALHDPRIDWASSDNFYVSTDQGHGAGNTLAGWPDYINHSVAVQMPRYGLGGVFAGYGAATHPYYNRLSANWASSGWSVGGYDQVGAPDMYGNPRESQLGDDPDNNPALVLLDYLTAPIYGAGVPVTDINTASIVAAANYCDAPAPTYTGGPSQPQMSCDLAIDTTQKLRDNLGDILKTCRGNLAWIDGQYHLVIRRAGVASAFDITADHIISRKSLEYGTKDKRFNRAVGTYVEPRTQYKQRQVVYPPADDADFNAWVAADGGINETDINLQGCANIYRAADLLATMVKESRASIRTQYVCTLELLSVTAGDVVTVTDDKFSAVRFWVENAEIDLERGQVLLHLLQHDDSAYDNLIQGAELPAPGAELLPDATVIAPVTGLTFTPEAQADEQTAGVLQWVAAPDVRVSEYRVQLYRDGESDALLTEVVSGASCRLPLLAVGDYVASVTAVGDLFRSAPGLLSLSVAYNDMPLPAVTGLRLIGGGAEFVGDAAFQLDVATPEPVWFVGYEWCVYAAGQLLRSHISTAAEYVYAESDNLADGGNRAITLDVRRVASNGQRGASAQLAVSQPQPAAPGSISVAPGVSQLDIRWRSDYAVAVYVSTVSGFVPAESDRVFYGTGGAVLLSNLAADTVHYIVLQAFDAFGGGVLSGELAVATLADPVPGIVSQLERLDGDEHQPGSLLQLIGAERSQRTINEALSAAQQAVLAAGHEAQSASVNALETVRQTESVAFTQSISLAQSQINDNAAAIYQEQQTRATETGSLSTEISLLRAQVNARPTFASGWEAGADWSRWVVGSGTLTAETTTVYAGLQSAALAGIISAAIPQPTADEFAGRPVRLSVYAQANPGTELRLRYLVTGVYDSGWLLVTAPAAWDAVAVTLDIPAGATGVGASVKLRAEAGAVLVDRLLIEDAGSELPEITAEIERISTAQADLETAVAADLQQVQSQIDGQLATITQDVQTKVDAAGVNTIVANQLAAKNYDNSLAAITQEQQAQADEQQAQASELSQLYAVTGAGRADIANRTFTMADDDALAAAIAAVQQAHSDVGDAIFSEYRRTAIGYCVDANGNPTSAETAAACELAGHTWVSAPLSEAISRAKIALPNGDYAAAGQLLQTLGDSVGELSARASLYVDVNGRIAGVFVDGSDTASQLKIITDQFSLRTNNGTVEPFSVEGDTAFIKNAVIKTVSVDKLTTTDGSTVITNDGKIMADHLQVGEYLAGDGVFTGTLNVKSASSGQRMEINGGLLRVYDSAGNLRVRLGVF